MSYATAFEELSKNNQYGVGAGFDEYTVENLVTPGISGLDNAEVMRAAFDVGIRQLVSDTSQPGQGNPTPNAGYYNALNPGLLMMPRRPTDLYFDVSQPSEWAAEYGVRHTGTFTYDQLIATVSDSLARYMLRGENDTWMFHQANLRDNGGGKSLLSDLLDAALREVRGARDVSRVEPGDGRSGREGRGADGSRRLGRQRDHRAGRAAVRAGDERGDGAGHRRVHARPPRPTRASRSRTSGSPPASRSRCHLRTATRG